MYDIIILTTPTLTTTLLAKPAIATTQHAVLTTANLIIMIPFARPIMETTQCVIPMVANLITLITLLFTKPAIATLNM
jgi:hypothetical protein